LEPTLKTFFEMMARLNYLVVLGLLLVALCSTLSSAFVVQPQVSTLISSSSRQQTSPLLLLKMSENNSGGDEEKLKALGYSEEEIQRSKKTSDPEQIKVRVDLVPDVDPVSLTAIGFGLIALNFFVLGNMGDGGIGGAVASVINTINQ
jgi:hypothetical protein